MIVRYLDISLSQKQSTPIHGGEARPNNRLKAAEIIGSRLMINGHMHSGGLKIHQLPWGSRYIYIDSSQQNRHLLVIEASNRGHGSRGMERP